LPIQPFPPVLPLDRYAAVRERRVDGLRRLPAALLAYFALCCVVRFDPAGGGPSFTPALRAFDKPIAIACFVFFAPCLPSRM